AATAATTTAARGGFDVIDRAGRARSKLRVLARGDTGNRHDPLRETIEVDRHGDGAARGRPDRRLLRRIVRGHRLPADRAGTAGASASPTASAAATGRAGADAA